MDDTSVSLLSNLKHLNLVGCKAITSAAVDQICENNPNLDSLDISKAAFNDEGKLIFLAIGTLGSICEKDSSFLKELGRLYFEKSIAIHEKLLSFFKKFPSRSKD